MIWPNQFDQRRWCAKCGKFGALNAHFEIAAPDLVCDGCIKLLPIICDFCAQGPAAWEFPCKNFYLPQYSYRSTENWLACERCAELVMNDNYGGLLDVVEARVRQLRSEFAAAPMVRQARIFAKTLHQGFARHRTGAPFRVDAKGNKI